MNDNQTRDELVPDVENAAEFRSRTGTEYADDARNARSAAALRQAAGDLAELPDDDPRLLRIDSFCRTVDDDAVGAYAEENDRIFSRPG